MLKAVIFDMDGTLTITENLHHIAFAEVFKKFGINFTLEQETREYAGRGSKFTFEDVFKKNGVQVTEEQIQKCMDDKRDLYKKIVQEREIPAVEGVKEFVKKVHDLGLKKIIATGNSDMDAVRFILKKVGLLEYFPEILSISEVPRGKPFPDVFLEAAKRLGVQANEAVIFEDAINGVEAATSAGIRCIALETTTDRESLLKAGASHVLKNYYQVTDQILYGS